MIFRKFLSFETGPASPRTNAIGMAFAASVLLILTVVVGKISYELDTTGLRTQGEVVQIIEAQDGSQRAVFQFMDAQGQIHRVRDSTQSSFKLYDVGEKVPLVYSQDNPSDARKNNSAAIYFGPILLGAMSLLFYGGAALIWRFRSRFQKDYEARRGRTIITVVNADGSVTQTTHSSVPVFRWTGIFLAGLGITAWLGALWLGLQGVDPDGQPLKVGFVIYLGALGGMLFLGAMASLRHAKTLQDLENRSDKIQNG